MIIPSAVERADHENTESNRPPLDVYRIRQWRIDRAGHDVQIIERVGIEGSRLNLGLVGQVEDTGCRRIDDAGDGDHATLPRCQFGDLPSVSRGIARCMERHAGAENVRYCDCRWDRIPDRHLAGGAQTGVRKG